MKFIYLDHAATTPVRPEVREAMLPFLSEGLHGNPSSIHQAGRAVRKILEDAREKVAALLAAASPREILFTSGGTESDNLAILGAVRASSSGRKRVIRSPIEHHAVIHACDFLRESGIPVEILPVDGTGLVDVAAFRRLLATETTLATIMTANNETGTIQPIEELAGAARERKCLFHTDAVQAAGKIPIDVRSLGVDFLSISAHKFGGPKGIGLLYARKGTRLAPLQLGGDHEFGKRAGTENVAGIVGLAVALELAVQEMESESRRIEALRMRLEEGIRKTIPGVQVNGHPARRLPHVLSVCFEGIDGEGVILHLDQEGIGVASGSACTSSSREPSHVLSAMGVPRALAMSATRYSLGRANTEQEIVAAIAATQRAVERIRAMSNIRIATNES